MDPLVSIIIPVYNGANYLREAIDSALAQTYSNIEIIVVNDGSNDGGATYNIAKSYGDKIRYFEKPNGGVSTALNLGIANMRGEYFSWLSHDDLYLPEKIQVEIDALRRVGDMSKIVYSNFSTMIMPERTITEYNATKNYRQEILETGALATVLQFISGCSLLIPKIYFDAYGGFDEKYRAVQDYKKWFEIFRGKRLIYLRDTLIISRVHSQQTGRTYSKVSEEEQWLYMWLVQNTEADDLVGSGLNDMYSFYSAAFVKHLFSPYVEAIKFAFQKLQELPETQNIEMRIQRLNNFLNDLRYTTYLLKNFEKPIIFNLMLRGISLSPNVKFVSIPEINSLVTNNNTRFLDYFGVLLPLFIDTPIRKNALDYVKLP